MSASIDNVLAALWPEGVALRSRPAHEFALSVIDATNVSRTRSDQEVES